MKWKEPRNSDKYFWTSHCKMKMRQYGLSAQRIIRVIKKPLRTEEGITGKTIAVVQPQSTRRGEDGMKTWSNEIWVMYQIKSKTNVKNLKLMDEKMIKFLANNVINQNQIHIISAWRFPGKTKEGECLPEEILEEIAEVV
jgi:hypothetical protein